MNEWKRRVSRAGMSLLHYYPASGRGEQAEISLLRKRVVTPKIRHPFFRSDKQKNQTPRSFSMWWGKTLSEARRMYGSQSPVPYETGLTLRWSAQDAESARANGRYMRLWRSLTLLARVHYGVTPEPNRVPLARDCPSLR